MAALTLADGRVLDLRDSGPASGPVVVYHHGTPGSATQDPALLDLVRARDGRLVTWSRPGYGLSDRHPGRSVADAAHDAVAVLDHLGIDRAVTMGWSGGGPHTLACGALHPERFAAVAVLAGVAPHVESQGTLDWMAGMGEANVAEFSAAISGEEDVRAFLAAYGEAFAAIQGPDVAEELRTLLPPADLAHLDGGFADLLALWMREAVARGVDGMVDDDLAFARPWGFDLRSIGVPVSVWQGSDDLMVPAGHGPWLASAIPGVSAHLLDGEGHLSVVVGHREEILDELLALAAG